MNTIIVDRDLCTKCGICSEVCAMGIVDPAGEDTLPGVTGEKSGLCLYCGHCEAFCPSGALLLNFRPGEREKLPAGAGDIPPETMGYYLKKRRSTRHFKNEQVPREKIEELLQLSSYAASGGNGQPVEWIVVHDTEKVGRIAALTIEWMKTLIESDHPMSGYVPGLIKRFEAGYDVVCRNAPHLLFTHIPDDNPIAKTDTIIAMTHFDIAAPSFGVGTCWAGFLAMAAWDYKPLIDEIGIPEGRTCGYAMMFGNPKYKVFGIPRRNAVRATWI